MRCTGCFQCATDCPFGAIDMVEIPEREHPVAHVDPNLCVSCGICAGSCAPMVVGPPGRTGRDEVARVRAFVEEHAEQGLGVVVLACERGAGGSALSLDGARPFPMRCAGNVHTSVLEMLIRAGAEGVFIATCPISDCWGREGPRWLAERVYHGREAELRESVDRRRLRIVHAGPAETRRVERELAAFRESLRELAGVEPEKRVELDTECDPPPVEEAP